MNFFRTKKRRSDQTSDKHVAFNRLCDFLESNAECQYSMSELEDIMEDDICDEVSGYTRKHPETKLKDYFKDNLIFTKLKGKSTIVNNIQQNI